MNYYLEKGDINGSPFPNTGNGAEEGKVAETIGILKLYAIHLYAYSTQLARCLLE